MGLLVPKRKSLIRHRQARATRTITIRDGVVSSTRDGQKRINGKDDYETVFDFDWGGWEDISGEARVVVSYSCVIDWSFSIQAKRSEEDLQEDDGKIVRAPESAVRKGAEDYLKSREGQEEALGVVTSHLSGQL